jgi:hypothetical protein
MNSNDPKELIKEFMGYLDYTEESDNGTLFHPVCITCSRVILHNEISACLTRMKKVASEE